MARSQVQFKLSLDRLAALVIVLVLILVTSATLLHADTKELLNRSLTISNSEPFTIANYDFAFQPVGLDTLETVVLQVCSNDPYPGAPCTAPAGFDASGAVLSSQTGDTGFTIDPASTANEIVLTRAPLASNGGQDSYEFTNVVNPATQGSYYARLYTFADSNINGEPTDSGGVAFAINDGVGINVTVPPYLLFCVGITIGGDDCSNVTGDQVDFGEFSSSVASQGDTQLLVATNALDGYTVRVSGTTLISGNNIIPALTASDVSRPGVSQFGLNLAANTAPQGGEAPSGPGSGSVAAGYDQPNFYQFNSGDVVAESPTVDEAKKFTVSYLVNVSKTQAPGVYVSTLTYIALGSF